MDITTRTGVYPAGEEETPRTARYRHRRHVPSRVAGAPLCRCARRHAWRWPAWRWTGVRRACCPVRPRATPTLGPIVCGHTTAL